MIHKAMNEKGTSFTASEGLEKGNRGISYLTNHRCPKLHQPALWKCCAACGDDLVWTLVIRSGMMLLFVVVLRLYIEIAFRGRYGDSTAR